MVTPVAPTSPPSDFSRNTSKFLARSLRALVPSLVILTLMRFHAFSAPLEADECNYGYIAGRMLEGGRLYSDVWDHHPPAMYSMLAGLIATFGDSPFVFRVAALVASAVSMILIYLLALHHFGWTCAWFSTLVFALSSSDPGIAGEGCNKEVYMNLLMLAAVVALSVPQRGRPWMWIFTAGLLLGVASLFKTVMAAVWVALAVAVLLETPHHLTHVWGCRARRILAFTAGPALIWLATLGYFAASHRAVAFADAVFGYNVEYSGLDRNFFSRFIQVFSKWVNVRTNAGLWIAATLGVMVSVWWRSGRISRYLLWGTVGALIAVALPGKPWSHYFQLLLPWAVIMSLVPIAFLRVPARDHPKENQTSLQPKRIQSLSWLYMVALGVVVVYSQNRWYLSKSPDMVAEIRYKGRDVWARDQGKLIAQVTSPEDTIFVWGNDPGLYYYSSRLCASRFSMINALTGDDESAAHRRALLLDDLDRLQPRLVFITQAPVPPDVDAYFRHHFAADPGMDRNRMIVLVDPNRAIPATDWNWKGPKPDTY